MIEGKLFDIKEYKLNGVRFAIRKLSPSLFMDKDYLFPMTNIIEKIEEVNNRDNVNKDSQIKEIEEFKDKMKDTILKGVYYLKEGMFSKKKKIEDYIDKIMEVPELYSALFSLIVSHTFGLKKKYLNHIELKGSTRILFT